VVAIGVGVMSWAVVVVDEIEPADAKVGRPGPILKDVIAEVKNGVLVTLLGTAATERGVPVTTAE
jgi:hypothetical protein